jgi:hypothetical protein
LLQRSNQGFRLIFMKQADRTGSVVGRLCMKDQKMYRDELNREAALIVKGRQLIVADVVAFWRRLMARFGF